MVSKLKQRPLEDGLIRCCVRLLAASHQFRNGIFQDADVLDSLRDFSLQAFMKSCSDTDPLAIQNSMDCCTLVSCVIHCKALYVSHLLKCRFCICQQFKGAFLNSGLEML